MNILTGDILDLVSESGGILVHQVNCRRTAGAGLALQIRRRWPEWYHAYRCTIPQLGRAWVFRAAPYVWIASLYAQRDIGRNVPQTDYTALRGCLGRLDGQLVEMDMAADLLLFPWRIGCGLAGGNWMIVQPMVEAAFPDANWVRLPEEVDA